MMAGDVPTGRRRQCRDTHSAEQGGISSADTNFHEHMIMPGLHPLDRLLKVETCAPRKSTRLSANTRRRTCGDIVKRVPRREAARNAIGMAAIKSATEQSPTGPRLIVDRDLRRVNPEVAPGKAERFLRVEVRASRPSHLCIYAVLGSRIANERGKCAGSHRATAASSLARCLEAPSSAKVLRSDLRGRRPCRSTRRGGGHAGGNEFWDRARLKYARAGSDLRTGEEG